MDYITLARSTNVRIAISNSQKEALAYLPDINTPEEDFSEFSIKY